MTLSAGDRLGPYEILGPLGAGGMGEVFRARDTRLGRPVAIKVLPARLAQDPQALDRFEREARAVAALSHPNILALHDVGRVDGVSYAVAELLEGVTLRQRLAEGGLPPRKAAEIAAQIARGLGAAHEQGVIHRDLKPENVFLTRDGRVKILDFGLAKLIPAGSGAGEATTIADATEPGTVLGTVGYMSPEQVRGLSADRRSDLFALGAILYELLTGRRAFAGDSPVETMSAILKHEPPTVAIEPPELEGALAPLVARCLEKSPEERFQDARDLAFLLEATVRGGRATREQPRGRRRWLLAGLAIAALVAGVLAGLGWARFGSRASPATAAPGSIASFGAASLVQLTSDPGYEGDPTFSPDGETIAYTSDRSGDLEIYLQQVAGGEAINLTRHPGDDAQPAFSPDGRQIAFVSTRSSTQDFIYRAPQLPQMGGDIWVMPALGGAPRRIAENGNYPSWSPDGTEILFQTGAWFASRILAVPVAGGAPREIAFELPKGVRPPFLICPRYSADGRWIVFQIQDATYVVAADGGLARRVVQGERPAWNHDSSAILFANSQPGKNLSLWRVPFSLLVGEPSGPAEPLTFGRGADTQPAAARAGGRIAFTAQEVSFNLESLPFDAEAGRVLGPPRPLTRGQNIVSFFHSSPDGKAIVYVARRGAAMHLWRVDPPADPVQLTTDPAYADSHPQWSPDGRTISFIRTPATQREAGSSLWLMEADGANPRRIADGFSRAAWLPDGKRLLALRAGQLTLYDLTSGSVSTVTEDPGMMLWFAVSSDGRWVAFQRTGANGSVDLAAIQIDGGGARRDVVSTPREDFHPFFSPTARWLYYQTDHKNIFRVPGPAQGWAPVEPEQVTQFAPAGLYLEEPQISRDGSQLFYARGRITGDIWLLEPEAASPSGKRD